MSKKKKLMNILEIQEVFQKHGFQWIEHIFNDDHWGDCMIDFTRDRNPMALLTFPRPADCVGWGRFRREHAWLQAYEWLTEKWLPSQKEGM